jgi:hypothetical protein
MPAVHGVAETINDFSEAGITAIAIGLGKTSAGN